MKKILYFIIALVIVSDVCAQNYGYSSSHYSLDSSQARFYVYRRHYSDINYPVAFAVHHSIAQIDGCNGEWGFWFETAGIEFGMGFDFGEYNETLVNQETTSWYGGNSHKIYYTYHGIKGSTMITYLGAYIVNWISVGAILDYEYGQYTRTKIQYCYSSSYLSSDFKDYGPIIDGDKVSWGIYVKGNYQFCEHYNIFLLGRACLNGNNGLVLGFGVNL